MTVQALASGSVTLDGSGVGRVFLAPDRFGVQWKVTRLVTGATADCDLSVYQNVESPGTLLDQTNSGQGDVSETDFTLRSGDSLRAVYSGGVAGTVATLVVYGELQARGA